MSRYQICISGAAAGDTVEYSRQLAYELGKAIAKSGHVLTTGATIGLPQYAAQGCSEHRGFSVGFSPASSYREHVKSYKLPTKEFAYINFTGMDYVGRDVYLVRSSDAVITVGGRMGSLHEFATAVEAHKICGVLLGSGGLADYIPVLTDRIITPNKKDIMYDTDPRRIVERIVAALDKKYADFKEELVDLVPNTSRNRRG